MHFGEVSNTTTTKSAHRFIHSKRNSSCSPEHKAWSILMTISVELFVTNFAESSQLQCRTWGHQPNNPHHVLAHPSYKI